MDYEDRISIATPEGIELEVTLAGVGSRFVALLVDLCIQWGVLFAYLLIAAATDGSGPAAAGFALLFFVTMFGYPVYFETRGAGRTPGKRALGLRVVDVDGRPVRFRASAIRTILRIVDSIPVVYLVGIVAVLASRRNQRLGDMAAGTIVVVEQTGGRQRKKKRQPEWLEPRMPIEPSPETVTWDVSAVTAEELATVRRYLERRGSLTAEARSRLAVDLAERLRPKVVGPPPDMPPEELLVELAALKAARG